ncbi:MAG: tyrosine-type recombinase/integrase [Terriglobia bacterium]
MAMFRRNGNWFIDFYIGPRRVREKVGPSKGQAKKALKSRLGEIVQGRFRLSKPSCNMTFKALAERYLKLVSSQKRGYASERFRIATLIAYLGKHRLSDLTAEHAERFKVERSKVVSPATINRELGNLKHILRMAIAWKFLEANPFAESKLLHVPGRPERTLGEDEEGKLLSACNNVRSQHLRPIVVLALNTGARKGEILGLKWSQVDFANRTIFVIEAKSEQGRRIIPMNDTVYDLLSRLPRKRGTQLVFPSPRNPGHRMRDHKVGFAKAVRLAKIPHIRFHDLRHTFASRLVRSGADLVTVQKLLGHARITMTSRYAHSLMADKVAAVKRLEAPKTRPVIFKPNQPLIGPRPEATPQPQVGLSAVFSVN